MFGYIKTYKPEMKICEYDGYKAVYCTLCKQLRKDYGVLARFTLNFDYTFLAMIRIAAKKTKAGLVKGRCPYKPFSKCNNICCEDDSLSFAAAVAMIMLYYKLKDTCHDEGFFKKAVARVCLIFASRWKKRAVKRYPAIEGIIADFCDEQQRLEGSDTMGLDPFAHPTAQALAQLFSYDIEDETTALYLSRIGYNVGKWVYLMDALDDFENDRKKGRFNPFLRRLGDTVSVDDMVEFASAQLNVCMDEACRAFDALALQTFQPIIKNILFLGLENVQNEIIRKVKSNE